MPKSARGESTPCGRHHSLAVEVNGYAAHSSPWAHDRDHRKEQYLLAAGYATRRFTALQAIDEPALVIAGIAAALALRSGSASGTPAPGAPMPLPSEYRKQLP